MSTPSSGGTAVGEALNILEQAHLSSADVTKVLHYYLEASALAFADRGRYVGAYTPPAVLRKLLSDSWARQRACQISPTVAFVPPVPPGDINATGCTPAVVGGATEQGQSTTNLTVADRWGNVVEYTLTIEQTGGNAMVVPGRGFLLNNELTDFNFTGTQGTRPRPQPARPGQAAAQLDVADDRASSTASRSWRSAHPGGATIITTVLQILVNRLILGMTLPEAIAAPRASQRNTRRDPGRAGLPCRVRTGAGRARTHLRRGHGGDRARPPASSSPGTAA